MQFSCGCFKWHLIKKHGWFVLLICRIKRICQLTVRCGLINLMKSWNSRRKQIKQCGACSILVAALVLFKSQIGSILGLNALNYLCSYGVMLWHCACCLETSWMIEISCSYTPPGTPTSLRPIEYLHINHATPTWLSLCPQHARLALRHVSLAMLSCSIQMARSHQEPIMMMMLPPCSEITTLGWWSCGL